MISVMLLFCAVLQGGFSLFFTAFLFYNHGVSHATPLQLTASDLKELKNKSGMLTGEVESDNYVAELGQTDIDDAKRVEYVRDLTSRQEKQGTQSQREHQIQQNKQEQRLGSAGRRTLGAFEVLGDKS